MKVLVACEFSAVVRDAFRRLGHAAWSCDLLPTEGDPAYHFVGDAREIVSDGWDLVIAHPPCVDLAVSGAQYWPAKQADGRQAKAAEFFTALYDAPAPHVAIENPVGIMSRLLRKPDQIIQPWQFGEPYNKRTCFWLRGLPALAPTDVIAPTHNWGTNSYKNGSRNKSPLPSKYRGWKDRSRTFPGIARAMAQQWGDFVLSQQRLAA